MIAATKMRPSGVSDNDRPSLGCAVSIGGCDAPIVPLCSHKGGQRDRGRQSQASVSDWQYGVTTEHSGRCAWACACEGVRARVCVSVCV